MKDYPLVILDWDYHTFDIVDEVGDVLAIYDEQAQNSEFIYIEGWLWCGSGYREKALYCKTENSCEYKRHLTQRAPDAGDSAASQALSPQSGESTPEVNPAATQRR